MEDGRYREGVDGEISEVRMPCKFVLSLLVVKGLKKWMSTVGSNDCVL